MKRVMEVEVGELWYRICEEIPGDLYLKGFAARDLAI